MKIKSEQVYTVEFTEEQCDPWVEPMAKLLLDIRDNKG